MIRACSLGVPVNREMIVVMGIVREELARKPVIQTDRVAQIISIVVVGIVIRVRGNVLQGL